MIEYTLVCRVKQYNPVGIWASLIFLSNFCQVVYLSLDYKDFTMKIGIFTQPLHANYGGLLQNYALQQLLIREGHEVRSWRSYAPAQYLCLHGFLELIRSKEGLEELVQKKKQ